MDYRTSSGYICLKSNPDSNNFLDKFHSDNQLDADQKEDFLEYLSKYEESTNGNILDYVKKYCHGNKLLGNLGDFETEPDGFKRIKPIRILVSWIQEITGFEQTDLIDYILDEDEDPEDRLIAFTELLELEIAEDIINDSDKCKEYLGIKALLSDNENSLYNAKIQRFIEWSFVSDEKLEDMEKSEIDNLVCRAGLSQTIDQENLIYVHSLDVKNAYKPTIIDAGFYDVFIPGGLTKPLEGCEDELGLSEYVHKPNLFKNFRPLPIKINN